MKVLFCVEFYFPSVGGAQEVVRRLAESFYSRGMDVHVATSALSNRTENKYKGVQIHEFKVSGNFVVGLEGDLLSYRKFLLTNKFDLILFYAAQQWTFDAAWPLISKLNGRKFLVPCGYSGLSKPEYKRYFEELPSILKMMDTVIYHSQAYQDLEFARSNKIFNEAFIPNGADIIEFACPADPNFLKSLDINIGRKIIMSVGSLDPNKGFSELLKSIYINRGKLDNITVVINGNFPDKHKLEITPGKNTGISYIGFIRQNFSRFLSSLRDKTHKLLKILGIQYHYLLLLKYFGFSVEVNDLTYWIKKINRSKSNIDVKVVDLNRKDLIQLYLNSDLFAFASKIEYSPLVLFEACAAGLPFLSANAGNAHEIAVWTNGGAICNFKKDANGILEVNPREFGNHLTMLLYDYEKLERFRVNGKKAICKEFNWQLIHEKYFSLLLGSQEK